MNARLAWLLVAAATGCASQGGLTERIASEKREIAHLERHLAAASTALPSDRDLYATLKYRPIAQWLLDTTTPAFAIHGVGVRREGDLVYRGGLGKAWIEPERDTWFDIGLKQLRLQGTGAGLNLTGSVGAYMESRVKLHVLNVGSNVLCDGRLRDTAFQAGLSLSPVAGNAAPYTLAITAAESLSLRVGCALGKLGKYSQTFSINGLAGTLATGTLELGFSEGGTLRLPPELGGTTYAYTLATKNPQLISTPDGIQFSTDVDVSISTP